MVIERENNIWFDVLNKNKELIGKRGERERTKKATKDKRICLHY